MKRKDLPTGFCPVPFSNIICHPDGVVSMCRLHMKEKSIGNLNENKLEDIWNSTSAQAWREEFLSGKIKTCSENIKTSSCNKKNEWLLEHIDPVVFQKSSPITFTANLYGKCNLQCPMCDVWTIPDKIYDKKFLDYLKVNIFSSVKHVDFYAGEPFIQNQTYEILEFIAQNNPDCRCEFTTNAQWSLTNKIKSILNRVKINNIHISIDSFDNTLYSKIRKNGNLNQALKTIKDLIFFFENEYEHKENQRYVEISTTVQKLNAIELPRFLKHVKDLNSFPLIQVLIKPNDLSILNYSENEKERLVDLYFSEIQSEHIPHCQELLRTIIYTMNNKNKKKYMLKLIEKLEI